MAPEPGAQFEPGRRLVRAQRVVRIWPCTESGNTVVGVLALVLTPSAPQRAATVTEQRAVAPAAQVRPLATPMTTVVTTMAFGTFAVGVVGQLVSSVAAGLTPATSPPVKALPQARRRPTSSRPRELSRGLGHPSTQPSVTQTTRSAPPPTRTAACRQRAEIGRRAWQAGTEQLIADQTLRRSRSLANSPVTTSTAMVWP